PGVDRRARRGVARARRALAGPAEGKLMRRALIVVVVLLAGAPALAHPPPNQQRREQIKQKIRTLRAYALTTELNLDEKTGGKLWPVLARYDDEIDKLLQQRVDVQRQL